MDDGTGGPWRPTTADTRCYMFVLGAFTDREGFLATYQPAGAPLIEKFRGPHVLVGRDVQVLEGDFPGGGGCVLSVWPDRAAAQRRAAGRDGAVRSQSCLATRALL